MCISMKTFGQQWIHIKMLRNSTNNGRKIHCGKFGSDNISMITNLLKRYAGFIFSTSWTDEENKVFLSLITPKKNSSLIDMGCGDGRLTELFAEKSKASKTIGVEPGKIR